MQEEGDRDSQEDVSNPHPQFYIRRYPQTTRHSVARASVVVGSGGGGGSGSEGPPHSSPHNPLLLTSSSATTNLSSPSSTLSFSSPSSPPPSSTSTSHPLPSSSTSMLSGGGREEDDEEEDDEEEEEDEGGGGGGGDADDGHSSSSARDDHRSLSDTDQPLHHHHQQQQQQHQRHSSSLATTFASRHFIHPSSPSMINPSSLSSIHHPHSHSNHHHHHHHHHEHSSSLPSPLTPPPPLPPHPHHQHHHHHHHPPTSLQFRPVSSSILTATVPTSSSSSSSSSQPQPYRGSRPYNTNRHNLTLYPLEQNNSRPRLSHTLSCPQGSGPPPSSHFINGVHRQVSVPVAQREVQSTMMAERSMERPNVLRSISRTQTIKNYIRKSTATFFGVDGENEEDHRRRWMERRKRMACKRYGQLKEPYRTQVSRDGCGGGGDASSTAGTAGTIPSLDTPDSIPTRSWPRQVSRVSDIDSITTVSSGVRLRTMSSRRQKDSVVRLTWDGLAYIASTVSKRRRRTAVSQPPSRPQVQLPNRNFRFSTDDSVFEESIDPYSPQPEMSVPTPDFDSVTEDVFYDRITPSSPASTPYMPPDYISPLSLVQVHPISLSSAPMSTEEGIATGWRRSVPVPEVPEQDELSVGMRRMWKRITDQLFDNSDRRQYGMGIVGRYLKRSFRKDRITTEVKEQLEDMDDHRPFFTYWVTTVQILITIISLAVYGFGPIGFEQTQRSGLVLVTSLSLQQIDYFEPDNFWIGPRAADLVHLGAKFAPCMRRDQNVFEAVDADRSRERNTACCIRNDNSGCVQTSRDECSTTISTWKKWHSKDTGPGGRISGSVCGQDPGYCSDPPSTPPYNWPDDITKWPICRKKVRSDLSRAAHEHMACEVIGHPCCIGILGECHITTQDYCDFVKGFFHEEAALCSQVSCLDDICGMIPFYNPDVPDQFYRLWTSLFLHAGLVHLSVTVLVQYFFMRDLEKLTGVLRISLIYIVSGVAGNLASAIFVPYRAEVGPAGSQFGLLACLIVEVIHSWQMLKKPGIALMKLLAIVLALFILGLLPWIDNYAHVFGFIFGFLLSYALLPFVSFGVYDRRKKISLIWICLLTMAVLLATLLLLFYIYPIYECEFCKYLTCVPLTQHFCTTQDINITTRRQL